MAEFFGFEHCCKNFLLDIEMLLMSSFVTVMFSFCFLFVLCCCRYTKKKKEEPTLREMQMKLEEDMNKRLTFNPHYYHASYVVS